MRKIVASLFMSLDGVVEAPENWHLAHADDELAASVGLQMAAADTLLLGRATYQELGDHWFADYVNATPKVVVSTSLADVDCPDSSLLDGDVTEALIALKRRPGRGIGVTGSPTLVESLIRRDLLDELRLLVHPVVVGSGRRLFEHVSGQRSLTLAASQAFATGVLDLTYRPR
jgi:dihydrofolate reductase